jgi:hypothetical protein
MANQRVKPEMKGTGGGRWCKRAEAKTAANKARRRVDRAEATPDESVEQLAAERRLAIAEAVLAWEAVQTLAHTYDNRAAGITAMRHLRKLGVLS